MQTDRQDGTGTTSYMHAKRCAQARTTARDLCPPTCITYTQARPFAARQPRLMHLPWRRNAHDIRIHTRHAQHTGARSTTWHDTHGPQQTKVLSQSTTARDSLDRCKWHTRTPLRLSRTFRREGRWHVVRSRATCRLHTRRSCSPCGTLGGTLLGQAGQVGSPGLLARSGVLLDPLVDALHAPP